MLPTANPLALEQLGWRSFQDLALTICEELFGVPVQQFSPVRDLGQDGLVELPYWNRSKNRRTVIQSKHTSQLGKKLTVQQLQDEAEKMKRLHGINKIQRYILVSNCLISAQTRNAVVNLFKSVGIKTVVILERTGIERQIRESSKLRAKVPRLYGIGDISSILDDRKIEQSRVILQSIADDLITFVPTRSYRRAVDTLNAEKMVVLLGDPASGKTTIANCLIIGAIDQMAGEPIIIKSFDEFRTHWNPKREARIFYFDDFLGSWSLIWTRVHELNENLDFINGAMKAGCRFIFTSRNYIWHEAQLNIKFNQLTSLKGSQVAIDLQELTSLEKAQILFNHVRNGNQPTEWRRKFASFFRAVVQDENFAPECARRLSRKEFTQFLEPTYSSIQRFVRQQGECLIESIRGLDKNHRGALAAVYMSGGTLAATRKEHPAVSAAMGLYGLSIEEIRSAISSMDRVFVKHGTGPHERSWIFKHPTIQEALAEIVQQEPDLVEIAVHGSPLYSLLGEAVCEGVRLKGAKFSVPEALFGVLIARIRTQKPSEYQIVDFLTNRASRSFRELFFEGAANLKTPLIASNLKPTDQCCEFLGALKKDGLLDEDVISTFDKAMFGLADSMACADIPLTVRDVLAPNRYKELIHAALNTIKTDTEGLVTNWFESWDRDIDPDSYFDTLTSKIEDLAASIDQELDEEFQDKLSDEIGSYLYQMREDYEKGKWENDGDDHDSDISAPTTSGNSVGAAEIDAIFSDIAD